MTKKDVIIRALLFAALISVPSWLSAANPELQSIFMRLDNIIENKQDYALLKEKSLTNLKDGLIHSTNDEQRYRTYDRLFYEYLHYSLDSATVYAEMKADIGYKTGRKEWVADSYMNMASVYEIAGMYQESIEMCGKIDRSAIPSYRIGHYYHLMHTAYRAMKEAAISQRNTAQYGHMADLYRDSLLLTIPEGNSWGFMIANDEKPDENILRQKLQVLLETEKNPEAELRHTAILYFSIARAYEGLGEREQAKKYLALTAISDLQTPVREYISLGDLAVMLYEDGDIERAYRYTQCALDDAIACNARSRTLTVSEYLPIINKAYEESLIHKEKQLRYFLVCLTLLALFLLLAIFFIWKQYYNLKLTRTRLLKANLNLTRLNEDLNVVNSQMKQVNGQLLESNYIKEEYLSQYMDLCTVYISKVENYRKELVKIAKTGGSTEVIKAIKSPYYLENELREFYNSFDNTFLHMFPGFVESVNNLLREEERIILKPGRIMNTELRILALIRLGVRDSVKISSFLGCSLSTVYNYRTKLRNAAKNSRDNLEEEVMSINAINL